MYVMLLLNTRLVAWQYQVFITYTKGILTQEAFGSELIIQRKFEVFFGWRKLRIKTFDSFCTYVSE